MATLRAILEMQGCLDTAVLATQDPRVMEVADAFLPGTSANSQWYQEIEAFMLPRGADGQSEPRTAADPINAMEELLQDAQQRPPTAPESSRFIYGLGAVIHLTRTVQIASMPFADPTADERGRSLLTEVFALTGGPEPAQRTQAFDDVDQLDAIADLFTNEFRGWRDWLTVSQQLVAFGVLSANAASVPLCNASMINYDGIESVVVDSVLSSNQVSLNNLKAVVDPRNWANDDPSFFCAMQYEGLRTDGWRRVLETVGFCIFPTWISPKLVTMLKFYKTTVNPNGPGKYEARLDYEPFPTPPSDGKITVDHGFINMWTEDNGNPNQPPVYVRTRKVCHIDGLSPYAMKRFVCAFGYAFIVAEMLFGSALNPPADAVPWTDPPEQPSDPGGQQQGGQGGQQPPSGNSAASTVISMVAQCVQELTVKQFDLADKWMSGQLTAADLAEYGAEVGARIASDPWKLIQAITQPKGGGK
jgi:hypothetical protein